MLSPCDLGGLGPGGPGHTWAHVLCRGLGRPELPENSVWGAGIPSFWPRSTKKGLLQSHSLPSRNISYQVRRTPQDRGAETPQYRGAVQPGTYNGS